MDFCIFQIWKSLRHFYSIKNRILCMLHMKITMLISLHKILNFLYFTLLKSVCKVFYMKHGILYTSYMKTWVVIFLHYIRDTLHFTHENQGIGFLKIRRSNMVLVMPLFHKWIYRHHYSWNMECFACLMHISRQRFWPWNMEFPIFPISISRC